MGRDGYHVRDLADVRPGMQHGNTRLLSRNMPYHLLTITFLVQLTVSAFALWLAMKLTKEDGPFLGSFYYESGKFKAVFFALSNSYYLSYDETPGRSYKIAEKSVTFGIDCGT